MKMKGIKCKEKMGKGGLSDGQMYKGEEGRREIEGMTEGRQFCFLHCFIILGTEHPKSQLNASLFCLLNPRLFTRNIMDCMC